jgi:hypothetical protein
VAENLDLQPSTEPNLMVRPGCNTCHAKLEPLAAYFTRIQETGFEWVGTPVDEPSCTKDPNGNLPAGCRQLYDPAFADESGAKLRSAYASIENAEAGPAGLAQAVANGPEFAACATKNVTESLLGRRTASGDEALLGDLERTFKEGGLRMRALVRAIVKSNAYRNANSVLATNRGAR